MDVGSWSVQYASANGTTWATTPLTGKTIAAGGYLLVGEAQGANTAAPAVTGDVVGTIAMSGTAGKVALVSSSGALACGGACAADPAVVDLVAYGAATGFAGSGPAPAPSNSTSVSRNATHANTGEQRRRLRRGGADPAELDHHARRPGRHRRRDDRRDPGHRVRRPRWSARRCARTAIVTAAYPTGGLTAT